MANELIKTLAKKKGVRLWQIADNVGMQDSAFSRMLRHELSIDKQRLIIQIIDEIAGGEQDAAHKTDS